MPLRAAVYVAPPTPFKSKIPSSSETLWSPISCTLIWGKTEALLVDTPITIAQTESLADWIKGTIPGKHLSTVYITHHHADHWLGIPILQRRFPGLTALATTATIVQIKKNIPTTIAQSTWAKLFQGDQLPSTFILPTALPAPNKFHLENHLIQAIEVGHSDTLDSTVLWVPDLRLAVCGDVVYGSVHQMLAEARTPGLQAEWIRAIENIEALNPAHVVAGHKREGEVDGVWHLEGTKKYTRDFMAFAKTAVDADELVGRMMEIYSDRFNPIVLRWGAEAAMKAKREGKL